MGSPREGSTGGTGRCALPSAGRRAPAFRALVRHRLQVEALLDGLLWIASLLAASLFRFGFDGHRVFTFQVALVCAAAVVGQWVVGYLTALYRAQWRVGSFEQIFALAKTVAVTAVVVLVCSVAGTRQFVPVSAAVAGGLLAFVFSAGVRSIWRLDGERRSQPRAGAERAIVFGSGDAGVQLVNALLADPDSDFVPVALLDDDPHRRHGRVRHLQVEGDRSALREVAARLSAQTVIIAIAGADSTLIRELSVLAVEARLTVKVLPAFSEVLNLTLHPSDVKPITEVDLLGRREIDTDVRAVSGYLTGRRVLVTGAGGSIGSELCRQIHRLAPAELIMVDRDESGLHQVQLSLEGRALLDDRSLVVCDIRDGEALSAVFDEHRPQVVFHAAALKHLPLLEMWPREAVKTNVGGTANVLWAAQSVGVTNFVNVSTDKAANPQSVLGYTKRITERLTAGADLDADGSYLSVRFGNVLGSRGSVLTTFRAQIAAGGPVTVTDPEVTRYFMTIEEAVRLVVHAGAVGRSGEVLVLDMGQPVKIVDVAKRLVLESGGASRIEYTGLRPGEKLHESLFGEGEVDDRPVHPLIAHVSVKPLGREVVSEIEQTNEPSLVKASLAALLADDRAIDLGSWRSDPPLSTLGQAEAAPVPDG